MRPYPPLFSLHAKFGLQKLSLGQRVSMRVPTAIRQPPTELMYLEFPGPAVKGDEPLPASKIRMSRARVSDPRIMSRSQHACEKPKDLKSGPRLCQPLTEGGRTSCRLRSTPSSDCKNSDHKKLSGVCVAEFHWTCLMSTVAILRNYRVCIQIYQIIVMATRVPTCWISDLGVWGV